MNKLEDILSSLLKNGLKISPKKCQLFKTSLQYMGNEIFIESKKVCVKPLRNRLEAIQKTATTKDTQGMQQLCRGSEFPQHVLSRTTKTPKTHIQFDKKRETISLGKRTMGLIS